MIVDAALPASVTVNLIMSAVPVTQPVTAPVVSVAPAAGIATFVTPPTGVALPTANVIVLGAVAAVAALTVMVDAVAVATGVVVPVFITETLTTAVPVPLDGGVYVAVEVVPVLILPTPE